MRWGLAAAVALLAARPSSAAAEPAPEPVLAPELEPDTWRVELALAAQPEQRQDYPCNANLDCMSASQWFVAGALAASLVRPDAWSAALTLVLGRASDFEERPPGGFGVASLRADVQVELGRGAGRFGAALRVSEVVALGWSDTGVAFATDIPGLALVLGERDLWGEVQIPVFPTELDPRVFYAGVGWRTDAFTVEGGLAQLGSLGYQHDTMDRTGGTLGLWGSGSLRVAERWDLTARMAVSYPFMLALGVAYRVDTAR